MRLQYVDTLGKGTITVADTSAAGAFANNTNKKVILNYAPFTNCISEIIHK